MLEARRQPYALAVPSNHTLRMITEEGPIQTNTKAIPNALAANAWTTLAAGEGSKGLRGSRIGRTICGGRSKPST